MAPATEWSGKGAILAHNPGSPELNWANRVTVHALLVQVATFCGTRDSDVDRGWLLRLAVFIPYVTQAKLASPVVVEIRARSAV